MVDGLARKYAGGPYDIRIVNLSKGDPADRQLYGSFGLQYVPTFVFLNSDGTVANKVVGSQSAAEIEAELAKLN